MNHPATLIRLSVVVVLYRTMPSDAVALTSMQKALGRMRCSQLDVNILVFDNTPAKRLPPSVPSGLRYHPAGRNVGLAAAYNWALDAARSNGSSWLLLLDQDTILPPEFFDLLWTRLCLHHGDPAVVALVPQVRSGGTLVSPKRVGFLGLRPMRESSAGVYAEEIMSINSGSVLRCDFVCSLGGFNEKFWLDFLDHWLFRQIYANGKKVAVFGAVLEHRLSVQDYRHNVTVERYRNILTAESAFIAEYKSPLQIRLHRLRLLVRSIKLLACDQPEMARLTFGRMWTFRSSHRSRRGFQASRQCATAVTDRERSK